MHCNITATAVEDTHVQTVTKVPNSYHAGFQVGRMHDVDSLAPT